MDPISLTINERASTCLRWKLDLALQKTNSQDVWNGKLIIVSPQAIQRRSKTQTAQQLFHSSLSFPFLNICATIKRLPTLELKTSITEVVEILIAIPVTAGSSANPVAPLTATIRSSGKKIKFTHHCFYVILTENLGSQDLTQSVDLARFPRGVRPLHALLLTKNLP